MGLYQVDWACGAEQKQQQMKQNGFRDEMGWAASNSEFNWFNIVVVARLYLTTGRIW